MDNLDKCYIWHIITLAKMKYKLRSLKSIKIELPYTDQSK